MKYKFKKLIKKFGAQRLPEDMVSIGKATITFREAVAKKLGNYAEIYYDDESRVLAIKPSDNPGEFTVKKTRKERENLYSIRTKSIEALKIKRGRYKVRWDPDLGMYLIEYEVVR